MDTPLVPTLPKAPAEGGSFKTWAQGSALLWTTSRKNQDTLWVCLLLPQNSLRTGPGQGSVANTGQRGPAPVSSSPVWPRDEPPQRGQIPQKRIHAWPAGGVGVPSLPLLPALLKLEGCPGRAPNNSMDHFASCLAMWPAWAGGWRVCRRAGACGLHLARAWPCAEPQSLHALAPPGDIPTAVRACPPPLVLLQTVCPPGWYQFQQYSEATSTSGDTKGTQLWARLGHHGRKEGTLTFSPLVPFRPRMPSAPYTNKKIKRVTMQTSEP